MDWASEELLIVEEGIGGLGSSPGSLNNVIAQELALNRQLQSVSMREHRKIRPGATKLPGCRLDWLRGLDLNQRPLGYEPNELPGCSTPHSYINNR